MIFKNIISGTLYVFMATVFLVIFFVLPVQGSFELYDHFDDGFLDVDWDIIFNESGGWTYNESGTDLNITNIVDPSRDNNWADVILSQTFTPLDDFQVNFNFSWDSEGYKRATQKVLIRLYDTGDNIISRAGYVDAWLDARGKISAFAGENLLDSSRNSLPLSGSASVFIVREDSNIDVFWDEDKVVSGIYNVPLARVDVVISYHKKRNNDGVSSFFGNESVDLVSVEGVPPVIPEPMSYLLFIAGGVILGLRCYMNKKITKSRGQMTSEKI